MKKAIPIPVAVGLLLLAGCSGQAADAPESPATATLEPLGMSAPEPPTESSLRVGDMAPDFTLPDKSGNMVNLAAELQENEQVVLVFYFGYQCSICMSQLRAIESDFTKYEEMGAQVLAIAVQGKTGAVASARSSQAQFPILTDSDLAVTDAYDVERRGLSAPSVWVINQDGHIAWKDIAHVEGSGCGTDRVSSETILENLS
jgi:peroxiredoxin Q/BCP